MKLISKKVRLVSMSVLAIIFILVAGIVIASYFQTSKKVDPKAHLKVIEQYMERDVLPAAERLKKNDPTLKDLEISYKPIGDKGAKVIAEALKANTILESLMLIGADIKLEGLEALEQALKTNKTLQYLNLDGNLQSTAYTEPEHESERTKAEEILKRIDVYIKRNQALTAKAEGASNTPL